MSPLCLRTGVLPVAFLEDADHCHSRKGWFPFLEGLLGVLGGQLAFLTLFFKGFMTVT